MNQWTQGYCLTKKTRGRKSRETVPLRRCAHIVLSPVYSAHCTLYSSVVDTNTKESVGFGRIRPKVRIRIRIRIPGTVAKQRFFGATTQLDTTQAQYRNCTVFIDFWTLRETKDYWILAYSNKCLSCIHRFYGLSCIF
jgi:hypothetical protein